VYTEMIAQLDKLVLLKPARLAKELSRGSVYIEKLAHQRVRVAFLPFIESLVAKCCEEEHNLVVVGLIQLVH
jgi:hypothetical protein